MAEKKKTHAEACSSGLRVTLNKVFTKNIPLF